MNMVHDDSSESEYHFPCSLSLDPSFTVRISNDLQNVSSTFEVLLRHGTQ